MAVTDKAAMLQALRVMTENAALAEPEMSQKCKLVAPSRCALRSLDFREACLRTQLDGKTICFEDRFVTANICVSKRAGQRVVLCLVEAEDESAAGFLHIFDALTLHSKPEEAEIMFPVDAKIAIKEPVWFSSVLHVSSPASVEFVGITEQRKSRSVEVMIKEGNRLLHKGSFVLADLYYTECINMFGSSRSYGDMEKEVFVKRAEARRKLGRYEEAVMDAEVALQIESAGHRWEALLTKGKSLSSLQEHQLALTCLESQPDPKPSEIATEITKCNMFLRQSRDGIYDIPKEAYQKKVVLEFSEYMEPVEVRMTQDGRGKGMFLTEDVKVGDLLLVCNPSAGGTSAREDDIRETGNDIHVELIRSCIDSERRLDQMNALADIDTVPDMTLFKCSVGKVALRKGNRVVDLALLSQVQSQGGLAYEALDGSITPGFWASASLLNHSCLPNACKLCVGRSLFIRAARDLKAGEEVLIGYTELLLRPFHERIDRLVVLECKCRRCTAERKHQHLIAPCCEYGEICKFQVASETARMKVRRAAMKGHRVFIKDEDLLRAKEAEIRSFVEELEEKMSSLPEEEKNWIRAGYVELYCVAILFLKIPNIPSCLEFMKILQDIAPGTVDTWNNLIVLYQMGRARDNSDEFNDVIEKELISRYGDKFLQAIEKFREKDLAP